MKPGHLVVHLIDPRSICRESTMACLTSEEKSRAARFKFEEDADRWSACRASLRMILGNAIACPPLEVPLILEEFGKPILAPPHHWLHFNLSHCNDLAAIAICAYGPVGIDLESMNRAEGLLECETSFCHPEEIADLPGEASARAFQLLRIWTAKEAVLKALGTGLSHPPEEVRIRFGLPTSTAVSKTLLLGINDQRLHSLEDPALTEHQAVVSAPKSVMEIEILKGFLNHP